MQQLFWKKVEIENKTHGRPPKLEEGAQLSYMGDQNKYIMTGGVKHPFNIKDLHQPQDNLQQESTGQGLSFRMGASKAKSEGQQNQDYIYIFEPSDFQWKIQQTNGRIPSRRVFHHVWYEAPNLFIYGGQTKDLKTLNDTYVLNTQTYQWKRFFYLEGPPPRLFSGFSGTGQRKYIIGGGSMPENLLLNDIWLFSFENVAWESQSLELPGIIWQKIELKEGAKLLPPIKGHSLIQVSETHLFLYGGYNQNKQSQDLSLLFNMESETLQVFETKGMNPGPRAFHKVIYVKENLICLFGGINGHEDSLKPQNYLNDLYLLNLSEGYWSVPIVGGYVPSPRYLFAFSGNENEIYGEVLLLGGRITDGSFDQCVYILHELDMDQGEAWDERNDDEKLQFSSYREAVKKDKKNTISTLTLEFNEAEKIILDQKRMMGEKEKDFKKIHSDCKMFSQLHQESQERIEKTKQILDVKLVKIREAIEINSKKATDDQQLIDKVKLLLAYERKKRKVIQRKANCLQDAFRKAENFIITMDQFYCKGLKDEAFTGNINDDLIGRIDKMKQEHRTVLTQFKNEFEGSFKREQHVRSELKAKKTILKPFENISQIFHSTLNKDDLDYFAKGR